MQTLGEQLKQNSKKIQRRKFKHRFQHLPQNDDDCPIERSSSKRKRRFFLTSNIRDPRFDERCGQMNKNWFCHSYAFLNDIRRQEIQEIRSTIKQTQDENEKVELRRHIQRLKHQIEHLEQNRIEADQQKEIKWKIIEKAEEGKSCPYLNRNQMKIVKLANKYRSLKASGKLESYLERKRRQK